MYLFKVCHAIKTNVLSQGQFSFFAAYVFMFGIIAYGNNFFENLDYQIAKRWLSAAFVFRVPFWILVICFGVTMNREEHWAIVGGWNWCALGYAFWESFYCVVIIIGLVGGL